MQSKHAVQRPHSADNILAALNERIRSALPAHYKNNINLHTLSTHITSADKALAIAPDVHHERIITAHNALLCRCWSARKAHALGALQQRVIQEPLQDTLQAPYKRLGAAWSAVYSFPDAHRHFRRRVRRRVRRRRRGRLLLQPAQALDRCAV